MVVKLHDPTGVQHHVDLERDSRWFFLFFTIVETAFVLVLSFVSCFTLLSKDRAHTQDIRFKSVWTRGLYTICSSQQHRILYYSDLRFVVLPSPRKATPPASIACANHIRA